MRTKDVTIQIPVIKSLSLCVVAGMIAGLGIRAVEWAIPAPPLTIEVKREPLVVEMKRDCK